MQLAWYQFILDIRNLQRVPLEFEMPFSRPPLFSIGKKIARFRRGRSEYFGSAQSISKKFMSLINARPIFVRSSRARQRRKPCHSNSESQQGWSCLNTNQKTDNWCVVLHQTRQPRIAHSLLFIPGAFESNNQSVASQPTAVHRCSHPGLCVGPD